MGHIHWKHANNILWSTTPGIESTILGTNLVVKIYPKGFSLGCYCNMKQWVKLQDVTLDIPECCYNFRAVFNIYSGKITVSVSTSIGPMMWYISRYQDLLKIMIRRKEHARIDLARFCEYMVYSLYIPNSKMVLFLGQSKNSSIDTMRNRLDFKEILPMLVGFYNWQINNVSMEEQALCESVYKFLLKECTSCGEVIDRICKLWATMSYGLALLKTCDVYGHFISIMGNHRNIPQLNVFSFLETTKVSSLPVYKTMSIIVQKLFYEVDDEGKTLTINVSMVHKAVSGRLEDAVVNNSTTFGLRWKKRKIHSLTFQSATQHNLLINCHSPKRCRVIYLYNNTQQHVQLEKGRLVLEVFGKIIVDNFEY